MIERDPLIDAIRAAGEVPPPPDRDAAFARAMRPVLMPSRRGLRRSFIALFAAALVAAPAAVFAAHVTRSHAAVQAPIVSERPDPGGSIHPEADDATLKAQNATSHESDHRVAATTSLDEGASITSGDDRSSRGPSSSASDDPSSPSSGDDHPNVSPTPTGSPGSSGDGGIPPATGPLDGSSDGATSAPH